MSYENQRLEARIVEALDARDQSVTDLALSLGTEIRSVESILDVLIRTRRVACWGDRVYHLVKDA